MLIYFLPVFKAHVKIHQTGKGTYMRISNFYALNMPNKNVNTNSNQTTKLNLSSSEEDSVSFTARPGVRPILAGNWKMNTLPSEVIGFFDGFLPLLNPILKTWSSKESRVLKPEVLVCPTNVCITEAQNAIRGTKSVKIGAQNCHFEEKGAYTGEVSLDMLKDLGVKHVIIGHSERRQMFNETNKTVNLKTLAALKQGVTPIVCCGESLEQRIAGVTDKHIAKQINAALKGVENDQIEKVVIAYEPIWAIGTGKTCESPEAERVCGLIREVVAKKYGEESANKVRILYGGSANSGNARELLGKTNIDGFLVGGASLKPSFADMAAEMKKVRI